MNPLRRVTLAACAILVASPFVLAVEQNGLQVTVGRNTLDTGHEKQGNQGRGRGFHDHFVRVVGLKATIRNATFKPMPEGEVNWTVLVRKVGSGKLERSSGTEKLKALKPLETVEFTFGSVTEKSKGPNNEKDTLEWQVIVKQDNMEVLKTASIATFDALAKTTDKGGKCRRRNKTGILAGTKVDSGLQSKRG